MPHPAAHEDLAGREVEVATASPLGGRARAIGPLAPRRGSSRRRSSCTATCPWRSGRRGRCGTASWAGSAESGMPAAANRSSSAVQSRSSGSFSSRSYSALRGWNQARSLFWASSARNSTASGLKPSNAAGVVAVGAVVPIDEAGMSALRGSTAAPARTWHADRAVISNDSAGSRRGPCDSRRAPHDETCVTDTPSRARGRNVAVRLAIVCRTTKRAWAGSASRTRRRNLPGPARRRVPDDEICLGRLAVACQTTKPAWAGSPSRARRRNLLRQAPGAAEGGPQPGSRR